MHLVGHLTCTSEVLRLMPSLVAYFHFVSADSRGQLSITGESMCRNPKGGLSLLRKSVVKLTDSLDMNFDVYRGRKTTTQQQCTPIHESTAFRRSYFTFICRNLHFFIFGGTCKHKYKCQNNKWVHANV